MKKIFLTLTIVALLTACTTNPYTGESQVAKTVWTTGIGTAVGAGAGALIGGKKGALIGAGAGAADGQVLRGPAHRQTGRDLQLF